MERALEVQKEVYLCFIHYPKAIIRVRHDEIITQLTQMKINLRVRTLDRRQQSELMVK